jgi:hypothetical protein
MTMKIKTKVFAPKFISRKKLKRAVENAMEGAARGVQVDMQVTTQTWKHQPAFGIDRPSWAERNIFTTDFIYGLVDEGTRPHIIVARNASTLRFGVPSKPKTTPRVIGSTAGSRGSTMVFTPRVKHPGTAPREFSQEISDKWRRILPNTLQRAIDSEVKKS